jgi:hypothetical protein
MFGEGASALESYANWRNRSQIISHYGLSHPAIMGPLGLGYRVLRDVNLVTFAFERGYQIGSGKEMFTGQSVSRVQSGLEFITALAALKVVQVGLARVRPPTSESPIAGDIAKAEAKARGYVSDAGTGAPSRGSVERGQVEVLSGSKPEHMNASIAEIHGYESMLDRGYTGIRGPGKTTARGADSIAFDPAAREIVVQDAKYRGPAGSYPSRVSPEALNRWRPDIKSAIDEMPSGPTRDAAVKAFEEGKIRAEVFKWPQ